MNKEEWLINEVDKWEDDKLIDNETGVKIKKQYELYRKFNSNIFTILFAILGAAFIAIGAGIGMFYSWSKLPSVGKVIVAVLPLILSYALSIYTILFKTNNRIWKESVAFFNVSAMFLALGVIVVSFHLNMALSQYLLVSSILTIPVLYIMQAVSPLPIYYTAILLWGNLNNSFGNAPILLLLFLLGIGLIVFNIKKYNKSLKYNVIISALAGLPFVVSFVNMLNGDLVMAALLYSTLLFAMRDIKRNYFHFKLISIVVSLVSIVYITSSQAWMPIEGKYGGILLGILTGIFLLASLAIEVFNTKDNIYEFSYLLILMGLSIIRYIWGCIHSDDIIFQLVFMGIGILMALLVSVGFVSIAKATKKMEIAIIGFGIIAISVLIKIFETNLFYLGRVIGFLALGCIFLILVVLLSIGKQEDAETKNTEEKSQEETNEEDAKETEEESSNEQTDDGGQSDEEDNNAG